MKALILSVILIILFKFAVSGQTDHFKPNIKDHQIDTNFSLFNRHGLTIDKKNNPIFDLEKKNFIIESKTDRRYNDPRDLIFPGASKYYRIRSNSSSFPNEKSFAIKPDTKDKLFLIIKNPFDTLTKN
jgi:hypothetical protein